MGPSAVQIVECVGGDDRVPLRVFQIRKRDGAWHVVERVLGHVGGIFVSFGDAVAFARAESRSVRGARAVIEFEGAG